eukprot:scaffold409427_cov75-Attheya_sp.AAC.1
MSTCTTYHFTIVSSRALCAMMNNLSREPAVARWSCSSDMVACKELLTDSLRGAAVTCSPPVRHLSPRKIASHRSWLPLSFQ